MKNGTTAALAVLVALAPALAAAQVADRLARLPQEAVAVFNPGSDPVLMLAETDYGVTAPRMLKLGDDYADGWKLTALSAVSATLTRGGVSRTFALLGQRAPAAQVPVTVAAPVPAAAPAAPAGPTILPPLRRTTANSSPATRVTNTGPTKDAVARGDITAIMALDGSAIDYLAAWASRNDASGVNMYNADNTDWSSARFVSRGGRLYVAVNVADARGRRMSSVLEFHPTEFDANPTFRPNWPIEVQGAPTVNAFGAVQVNGAALSLAPRTFGSDGAVPVVSIGSLSVAPGAAAGN